MQDHATLSGPMQAALNELLKLRSPRHLDSLLAGRNTMKALVERGLVDQTTERRRIHYAINEDGRRALRWLGRNPKANLQ